MNDAENRISDYIDALNAEQEPKEPLNTADPPELDQLLATVRLVRSLREPALPESGYAQRIAGTVVSQMKDAETNPIADNLLKKTTARRFAGRRFWPAAALIAGLLLFAVWSGWSGLLHRDSVYAMEKAVAQLSNYHGMLEISAVNANGEKWMVRRMELWSDGDKYAVQQNDGTLTVNNGIQKWQVRPQSKEVALLPLLPDPCGNGFDLRDEAARAKRYPHKAVGSEVVSGRETTKLEISPPGGLPYYLWVDVETGLPIQLQTAMQNALQTTTTFISFEPNTRIDPSRFNYLPPKGYRVVEDDPGQLVATVAEAAAISRLTPLIPQKAPARIMAYKDRIVLDYGDTTIVQTAAKGDFEPVANSALGTAAGGPLEVWWERLRWRQNGIEIQAEGPQREELARQITADLALPDTNKSLDNNAQVRVPVDMEIVKADQRQVDGGHAPWQLDPAQVALTFVNLKVSPDGIIGEPKISASCFEVAVNNGVECVVEVDNSPVRKVYLKRLVRQDETGIWSVVGYERR